MVNEHNGGPDDWEAQRTGLKRTDKSVDAQASRSDKLVIVSPDHRQELARLSNERPVVLPLPCGPIEGVSKVV